MSKNEWHEGPVQTRPASGGGTNILCVHGHFIDHVRPGDWPHSVWSTRATDPNYTHRCYGKLIRK